MDNQEINKVLEVINDRISCLDTKIDAIGDEITAEANPSKKEQFKDFITDALIQFDITAFAVLIVELLLFVF